MRLLIFLITTLVLVGCNAHQGGTKSNHDHSQSLVPEYSARTFRADVMSLVEQSRYRDAVAFIGLIDPESQADFDVAGYLAVGEDMIVLPGVYPEIQFDRKRDWEFPGTSDLVVDGKWQKAATAFAARYNEYRRKK